MTSWANEGVSGEDPFTSQFVDEEQRAVSSRAIVAVLRSLQLHGVHAIMQCEDTGEAFKTSSISLCALLNYHSLLYI